MHSIGGGREETRGNVKGFSEPDWKYGFEYNPADHLMFYGNFASSYRQPSAGGGGGPGMISKAEILDSYMAGMKSRWLGNKLQVNVSAYFYDYANKLCSGFKVAENITEYDLGFIDNNNNGVWDPGIDEDYASLRWNAGRGQYNAVAEGDGEYPTRIDSNEDGVIDYSEGTEDEIGVFTANEPTAQGFGAFQSLGLDLQTSWIITSKDRLNFSISYLNSEWIDLHFDFTWDMIFPDEDYYGITPVNSPELSATASYQHTFTLGEYGTLTPMIDMQYKSDYTMLWDVMNEEEARNGYQEPYVLWDASASFYHYSGKWSLNAYIKNITNYAVKRSYHGMVGNRELRLGDPRTYALSFSIKF
jgi:outer membrane receptor protein involved in Fe transport